MNVKEATEKLNMIFDKAMETELYDTALEALKLMPRDTEAQIKVVKCDEAGNITIDFAGLMFGKKVKKITAINYVVKT